METTEITNIFKSKRTVFTGIFAVLAVIALGAGIAFATGATNPAGAFAFVPPVVVDPVIVTAPVVVPVTPIIPVVPIVPVVVPVTPVVSVSSPAAPSPTDSDTVAASGDTSSSNASSNDDNTVSNVTVTAPTDSTSADDSTPLSPVVVTAATPDTSNSDSNTIDSLTVTAVTANDADITQNESPCCTLDASTPATSGDLSPVIVQSTPDVDSDITQNESPCCTLDTNPTPIIPVTTTDVDVPVIIPPVIIPPVTPPVTPPTPPVVTPAQCIYLTADKTTITPGEAVTLSYKTQDATSISIDQGVGTLTPIAEGSTTVYPQINTTYTATVTGATGSVNCQASVVVTTTPPPTSGAQCVYLTADKTSITSGETVTLSYKTQNATSISIDNGVGTVSPTDEGTVTVNPTSNTTYTATVTGATGSVTCQAPVVVTSTPTPNCSDTNSCGGGGGGSSGGGSSGGSSGGGYGGGTSGQIAPQTYVYLSQIPYTGLDLGPVGTVIYWVLLVLWCAAAAYLAIFVIIPFVYRRLMSFGANMEHALNQPALAHAGASHGSVAPSAHAPVAYAPAEPAHSAPVMHSTAPVSQAPGFAAFATPGAVLTIDDIVKGLSRHNAANAAHDAAQAAPVANTEEHEIVPVGIAHEVAPLTQAPEVAAYVPQQSAPRAAAQASDVAPDVHDFIGALLHGDRVAVFGAIRQTVREGGDAEAFLTQVVCALDDAYRAPMEGTPVHPEIAKLTAGCAPAFLERLISALTNAVDSSYSAGITGAKLAATRALAVVEG